jgi:hypothetical protein
MALDLGPRAKSLGLRKYTLRQMRNRCSRDIIGNDVAVLPVMLTDEGADAKEACGYLPKQLDS